MNKTIIELNGKRYDATSGALLGESTVVPVGTPVKPHLPSGRNLDGFIRQAPAKTKPAAPAPKIVADIAPKPAQKTQPAEKPVAAAAKPAPSSVKTEQQAVKPAASHSRVVPITAHQPEHTKTLMGRAAQKPHYALKPAIKPQAPTELMAKPASAIEHKHSVGAVDPDRLLRAQTATKHAAVSRFSKAANAELHAQPVHHRATTHVPIIPVRPAPLAAHAHSQHTHKTATDIFEAAIAEATAHLEPHHKIRRSTRRKIANFAAGGAALLVIGGFIAFLNIPNIQIHVASIQAGFHANVPSYAPVGYAMTGGVVRQGNTVSIKYQSGAASYTLTQQPSNWDNATLVENTLPLQSSHATLQVGGRTVYMYDKSSAVWVTGNVRYDVTGNAPLSSDDISHLAMSL